MGFNGDVDALAKLRRWNDHRIVGQRRMYAHLLFVVVGILAPRFVRFLKSLGQELRLGSA
jgi:hypothetical protein